MYLIFWIAAILLIGIFTGIQVAFVNLNRLNVELKKKQGRFAGLLFSSLLDEPSKLIGFSLVGFNFFMIVYGLLIGEMLQPLWNGLITYQHIPPAYVNTMRFLFETLTSTLIVLLFGEFIPRAIWKANSDWLLSSFMSRIVQFFYVVLNPIATIFVNLSEAILKYFFNVRLNEKKEPFSRSDLEYFIQQTQEQDLDNQELNTELFENALTLPGIKVRQCLVPRKEIEGIDIATSMDEVKRRFTSTKLSKLLVYEGNIDHIQGYIHQLDLFKRPPDVKSMLLPIPAVPESMSVTDLINKFTRERKSIAWVVDEFGGTAGIVTMEDLLEEIFGEIKDEYDTEEFEDKQLSDEEYILSGRLELDYLTEKYGFEFSEHTSETLSGYIIHHHETIPKVKDRIIIGRLEFEVMSVSDTRIEMVRVRVLK
jgi:putative hemolysin